MNFIKTRLIFGQLNSISPKIQPVKISSVADDFAFVGRMFSRTGNNIKEGINATKKSDGEKRAGGCI